jgi:hypothetical protein
MISGRREVREGMRRREAAVGLALIMMVQWRCNKNKIAVMVEIEDIIVLMMM